MEAKMKMVELTEEEMMKVEGGRIVHLGNNHRAGNIYKRERLSYPDNSREHFGKGTGLGHRRTFESHW